MKKNKGDILIKDAHLTRGQFLTSSNRRFRAVMEQDGNFVLYVGKTVLWSTDVKGNGSQVVMQEDGNLVLLDEFGDELWSTNTPLRGDYLICQDDGNLTLLNKYGESLWSSNTASIRQKGYHFFVLEFKKKIDVCCFVWLVKWIWNDDPGHFLIRQGDGNWTEVVASRPSMLEYTFLKYDDDDSPIIFRRTSPKDRYLKLTNNQTISGFGSIDSLLSSNSKIRGKWETQSQLGPQNLNLKN